MSNNTSKSKRKTVTITWPTTHFTIEDVWTALGGEAVIPNITLRFRVKRAIDANELTVIGKVKPVLGRPKLVLARSDYNTKLIEAAKSAGVILTDNAARQAVPVMELTATKQASTETTPKSEKAVASVATTK